MKSLRPLGGAGLAIALYCASPAFAAPGWTSHATPGDIGTFEVPCSTETLERSETERAIRAVCRHDGLLYAVAILPLLEMAPLDLSADEAEAYTFEQLEAEAAKDPATSDFLAVEYGGLPGFYGRSMAPASFNHSLIIDLGNDEVLALIATADTITADDPEAAEAERAADAFLKSFKLKPR